MSEEQGKLCEVHSLNITEEMSRTDTNTQSFHSYSLISFTHTTYHSVFTIREKR